MLGTILTQMWATRKRTLAIVIAIVIGVAFVTFSLLAGNLVDAQLARQVGNQVRGADIIVTAHGGELTGDVVQRISSVDSVGDAEPMLVAGGQVDGSGRRSYMALGQAPELRELRDGVRIEEGRLPDAPGEIAVSVAFRDMNAIDTGDVISWQEYGGEDGASIELDVVGVFEGGPGIALNAYDGIVVREDFENVTDMAVMPAVLVTLGPGNEEREVRESISALLGDGFTVETFQEFVDRAVEFYSGGALTVQVVIGVFSVIAMFAAGIVITNTFQITITQRIRELATMRCIGATGPQIRRSVIVEAVLLGVVASIMGTAAGVTLAALVNTVAFGADERARDLGVGMTSLMVPILAGSLVTVVAAMKPAGVATRVHPLQAIRSLGAPVEDDRVGILRRVGATGMIVIGAALLAAGVWISRSVGVETGLGLMVGVLGGMISFLGMLVGARLVVPPAVALVGRLARAVTGVSGEIATMNLQRNPGRTSSTAGALVMGVTLVTMCLVGVATVKDTFIEFFDERAAIDLDLRIRQDGETPGGMTPELQSRIADVDGVDAVAPIDHARVMAILPDGSSTELPLVGIGPSDAATVSRSDGVAALTDDVVIIGEYDAEYYGFEDGMRVRLENAGEPREVTVVVKQVTGDEGIVSLATLQQVTGAKAPTGLWIRIDDGVSVRDASEGIEMAVPAGVSFEIGGSAHDREINLEAMDQILLVAVGLLGVAVLIAVIGVGNTLTLSVLERSRESGMLRAMGMTAAQMRTSLAVEGVLLALAGALVGAIAGTVYGWAGALTLFGDTFPVEPGFPVGQLALVGVLAVVSGLIASVVPARHALRVSPVEALATGE